MTTTPTQVERRQHARHKARTRVQVRCAGKTKLCVAVNLSATGVGVATQDMSLCVGAQAELSFALSLGDVIKVHRRHAVVKHIGHGITGFQMLAYGETHCDHN